MMADIRNLLMLILVLIFLPACSPTLFPVGEVNICPGDARVFICQVSAANTSHPVSPHIEWLVQFEAPDLSDILQSYIVGDHLGDIHVDARSGYTFVFNLTSDNTLNFVSTLTVTLDAKSMGSFGIATVDCNQENESATLYITTDLPSSPMNLRQISVQGSQQITLQWNESEAADHYIVAVSPSVIGPSSSASFVTLNSTVGIPVSYNQEYNISVVASNCAGNSTPAEITILATSGCSSRLVEELTFMSGWISDTCSTIDGSSINIQCSNSLSSIFTLVSVCSSEGKWKHESVPVTQAQWPSRTTSISGGPSQTLGSSFPPLYALPTASGFSFVFGLLLGVMLTVCIMKQQARKKVLLPAAQDQKHMPDPVQMPVYEELCVQVADLEHTSPGCKVVDNVAYGPICN